MLHFVWREIILASSPWPTCEAEVVGCEGCGGGSETSCGYWQAVAVTGSHTDARLPLQSQQDRERTRGKGHWDGWATSILWDLLIHKHPTQLEYHLGLQTNSNIIRGNFQKSWFREYTTDILSQNYETTDTYLGTSLESYTFMIELEKLKLKKDHNLPIDNGKDCQKPEHQASAQNSQSRISLLLSKLFISTFSTLPFSRNHPTKPQSSNHKLGSYHHSFSSSTRKTFPLLLILAINID